MAYMRKINVHPYPCEVWFTDSPAKVLAFEKKIDGKPGEPIPQTVGGICYYSDGRHYIAIGLFDDSMFSLVHEVTHAVLRIFECVGMEVCHETTEAHAYLTESIFRQCYKIHDKLREIEDEQEATQAQEQTTIADIARGTSIRTTGDEKPPAPPAPGS